MSSDLPEGWAVRPILDIVDYEGGAQPPKSTFKYAPEPGYVRLLQIRDFGNSPFPTYVPDSQRLKRVREDDLLLARYGGGSASDTLGRICTGMSGAYNVALAKLVFPRDEVLPGFLRAFFLGPWFKEHVSRNSRSCQSGFNRDDLRDLELPVPPLAEQRRIVAKVEALLAEVNAARERLAKVPTILKRFRQSVLAAACSGRLTEEWRERHTPVESALRRLERLASMRKVAWEQRALRRDSTRSLVKYKPGFEPNPPDLDLLETWGWASVSQLALLDVGFAFPSKDFVGEGLPLLRGENTAPGRLRWDDVRFWPRSRLDGFEHLIVNEGDLILGMDRPIIAAGLKLARADSHDVPCLLVQRVMRIATLEPETSTFLYFALLDGRFQAFLQQDGMTGSDLPHITGNGVAEFPVALPPLEEQREIVRRVEALFGVADAIEKHVATATARADKIQQAILAKAFRGELVPTEAELAREEGREYEPASVLLAQAAAGACNSKEKFNGLEVRGSKKTKEPGEQRGRSKQPTP